MILYVDISNNQLVGGLTNPNPIDSLSLPWFSYAKGVPLQIYLLQPVAGQQPSQTQYEFILTTQSEALQVQIDDGTPAGAALPYTQQVNFVADAQQQQFWESDINNTGGLAMNTNTGGIANTGIVGLVTGQTAYAFLRISSSFYGTIFTGKIAISPGIPGVVAAVAAGLTPISRQEVLALCVLWANNPAGQGIVLTSPAGHLLEISAQDNGDGTLRLDESEIG